MVTLKKKYKKYKKYSRNNKKYSKNNKKYSRNNKKIKGGGGGNYVSLVKKAILTTLHATQAAMGAAANIIESEEQTPSSEVAPPSSEVAPPSSEVAPPSSEVAPEGQEGFDKRFYNFRQSGRAFTIDSIALARDLVRMVRENVTLIKYLIKGDPVSRKNFKTEITKLLSVGNSKILQVLQSNERYNSDVDTLFIKVHEKIKSHMFLFSTNIIAIIPAYGPAVNIIMTFIKLTIEALGLFRNAKNLLDIRNSIAKN